MLFLLFRIIITLFLVSIYSTVGADSGDITNTILSSKDTEQNIFPILPSLFSSTKDSDLDIFISRYIGLSVKSYIPPNLENIENLTNIEEAGRKSKLRKEAHDAL